MVCPHLRKDVIYICGRDGDSAIPGVKKLRDYCKCGKYAMCPDYQASMRARHYFGFELAS